MAPVIDVDDGAFNDRADECAVHRDVGCLPWRAHEDVPQAEQGGGQHHREIEEARKPAAGEESVQVGVVRVLDERLVELSGPMPNGRSSESSAPKMWRPNRPNGPT